MTPELIKLIETFGSHILTIGLGAGVTYLLYRKRIKAETGHENAETYNVAAKAWAELVTKLQDDILRIDTSNKENQADLEKLRDDYSSLRTDHENLKIAHSHLKDENAQLEKKVVHLEKENATLRKDLLTYQKKKK